MSPDTNAPPSIARLRAAFQTALQLVEFDDAYVPIFGRIDEELRHAEAMEDPLARARAKVLDYKANA